MMRLAFAFIAIVVLLNSNVAAQSNFKNPYIIPKSDNKLNSNTCLKLYKAIILDYNRAFNSRMKLDRSLIGLFQLFLTQKVIIQNEQAKVALRRLISDLKEGVRHVDNLKRSQNAAFRECRLR